MALKPITLRLDQEEYEKLKKYLEEFGDPDINVAFILRSYIRDLNRAMPLMVKTGVDLKNYFALLGTWLKNFGSMTEADIFSKLMNPWALWNMPGGQFERGGVQSEKVSEDGSQRGRGTGEAT